MYHYSTNVRKLTFRQFNRKGWGLFACLHREVRIGVLSVATLACAAPRLMAAPLCAVEGQTPETQALAADTLLLGEAGVTASRAPLAADVAARQVTTLTREDLAAAGVHSLNDALKLSASVDVRQRGGFGIQTDVSLDGGTHDQLTILLNGVPLVNPQTGHNAADFPVNISDVERIEILEGAASRVMGSQAFSGAINVVTRSATEAVPLEARFEAGSFGTVRGEARTAWRLRRGWAASASGGGQRSDGAVANGDFKGGKGFGQLSYADEGFRFDVQAGVSAQDFGANTFYAASYPDQWEATRRYLVSARAVTTGRIRIEPRASWLRSLDHYQLTRGSTAGENFHRSDVSTVGVNVSTRWQLGHTAVGAELREETLLSTNLGHALTEGQYVGVPQERGRFYTHRDERTNTAYFAEHNVLLRRLTVSLGVLAERNSAIDGKFRFYPGVDVSFRPSAAWRLYASWNRSLRLPSFTDLWYKSPTQEGNVGLRPEECSAFRLGADWTQSVLTLRLKAHYRRGTHMIDWVMRTADDIYHATAFSLDAYGAGMDANVSLTRWWGSRQPLEAFSVSYAWLHQHRRAGEPYFKSNYAMEYLRHKFVARLRHRIVAHLNAEWTLRVQQRAGSYLVYRDLKPTAELRPYGTHALLDCKLTWTARRYALFADLTNLTNHHYYDLANVRQPGFLTLAGVSVKL